MASGTYTKRWQIKALFLFAFLFFQAYSTQSEVIYYPGSFNPFHQTHFDEVMGALKTYPDSEIVILPIERTYYNNPHHPRVLSYEKSLEFIATSFRPIKEVKISSDMRVIKSDVFHELSGKCNGISKILVGADVLHLWTGFAGFSNFLKKCKLIVSEDPKTLDLNMALRHKFRDNPNIEFTDYQTKGIRSFANVQKEISQGDFSSLPKSSLDWIAKHQEEIIISFYDNLDSQLLTEFNTKIKPQLIDNGVPERLIEYMLSNKSTRLKSYGLLIGDLSIIGDLLNEMILHRSQLIENKENFYSSVITYMSQLDYRPNVYTQNNFNLLLELDSRNKKSRGRPLEETNKLFKRLRIYFWAWAHNADKKFNIIKRKLFSFDMENNSPSFKNTPMTNDGYITLYRGVSAHPDLAERTSFWKRNGFLSKTALREHLNGKTIEESLKTSTSSLDELGPQKAVVNHILGDWKTKTSLISTTLNQKLAMQYAGKDGILVTIRIPVRDVIFTNDLQYWIGTPFEEKGNPKRSYNEVLVPHRIRPNQIVSIQTVEKTYSFINPPRLSDFLGPLLKSNTKKMRKSCIDAFKMLFSSINY